MLRKLFSLTELLNFEEWNVFQKTLRVPKMCISKKYTIIEIRQMGPYELSSSPVLKELGKNIITRTHSPTHTFTST